MVSPKPRGPRPAPPCFVSLRQNRSAIWLRRLRSLLRGRSLRASARWLRSLDWCRLRQDSRRTHGEAEAVVARAERRVERVAVRRPAIRRDEVPTAATEHAERALFGTERIHGGGFPRVTIPIVRPLI